MSKRELEPEPIDCDCAWLGQECKCGAPDIDAEAWAELEDEEVR
jgi:hypothetical protein